MPISSWATLQTYVLNELEENNAFQKEHRDKLHKLEVDTNDQIVEKIAELKQEIAEDIKKETESLKETITDNKVNIKQNTDNVNISKSDIKVIMVRTGIFGIMSGILATLGAIGIMIAVKYGDKVIDLFF